jgi:hypothetical protein
MNEAFCNRDRRRVDVAAGELGGGLGRLIEGVP